MSVQETSGKDPILSIEKVSKAFGGVQAVRDVSFSVAPLSIQAVIGPNGAGKTTLFNLITGVFTPDSGGIFFRGRPLSGVAVHKRVEMGIARTFQNVELFSGMSVLENVLVGRHTRTKTGFLGAAAHTRRVKAEETAAFEKARALLDFVGLSRVAEKRAGDLPFGWQRMAEIARALASDPAVILLDEPAAGLNASETGELAALIRRIRDTGVTVILVEHDMSLTMEVSDQIAVLDQGALLAFGAPRQIQANKEVIAAYLGT
ncbi:MAG: ABC transporter ATP-binding protein [Deltaproteobacteria bacterium]|nr:ABC transporter ATP-binding protein [Deltaproteobacteria bacterium]